MQTLAESPYVGTRPSGNRIKNVTYRGETRFDTSFVGMNASLHNSANAGH